MRQLGGHMSSMGFIVLMPPLHDIDGLFGGRWSENKELAWKGATLAHMNRIGKADIVLMANFDGYLGVSSSLELGYAVAQQKIIVSLIDDSAEPARQVLFDFVLGTQEPLEAATALADVSTGRPRVDVAQQMLDSIRRAGAISDDAIDVTDLWPACTVLAEAGLLLGDEAKLGAVRIGPFRMAATRYQHAVLDLIDILLPAGVVAIGTGAPKTGALTGIVRLVCKAFTDMLRRGVVFGRTEADKYRFQVLLVVDSLSEAGAVSADDIASQLKAAGSHLSRPAIEEALEWLQQAKSVTGETQALVIRHGDGRYSSGI